MEKPLVSIIMGVYNANQQFLKESIDSILNQTYSNFEFIICDDASTNGTSEWLAEYARKDSRIRLLQNPTNMRLASTLNRCIAVAKGTFLARQDDDDVSHPQRLEKQVAFLMENPDIDFVGSNCSLYNTKKDEYGHWKRPALVEKKDFLFNSPFIHGSLMFRNTCLNTEMCYSVSKWTKRTEDYELFMRMYAAGKLGANIQEDLYRYHCGHKQQHIAMHYRVDEMVLRYRGFRAMGLLPKGLPYVFKPIILGIMPENLVCSLREMYAS